MNFEFSEEQNLLREQAQGFLAANSAPAVARKVLENWIYWFVIDAVSIGLYVNRELYFTAALFVAYLVMIVFGYLSWRRSLLEQQA